jgi:hypothetical protein
VFSTSSKELTGRLESGTFGTLVAASSSEVMVATASSQHSKSHS